MIYRNDEGVFLTWFAVAVALVVVVLDVTYARGAPLPFGWSGADVAGASGVAVLMLAFALLSPRSYLRVHGDHVWFRESGWFRVTRRAYALGEVRLLPVIAVDDGQDREFHCVIALRGRTDVVLLRGTEEKARDLHRRLAAALGN